METDVVTARKSSQGLKCAVLLAVLVFLPSALAGQDMQASNNPPTANTSSADLHPVLVELFTSEGCSTCPPADRLIQKWDAAQPISGAQLIVMSEHVTYWNHDGWKDPNSSDALTDRQKDYEGELGEKDVYTPQVIVDGTHNLHLQNAQEVKDALVKAAAAPKIAVRISDVSIDGGNPALLKARIETDANDEDHKADVYVAVALDHVESQVLHGENEGKHLVHVAVVQELTKVGKLPKGKSFAEDVQLKLKPGTDLKNIRVIAFVQEPGPGKLLGAALRKPTS
jgi:hypothetical protein